MGNYFTSVTDLFKAELASRNIPKLGSENRASTSTLAHDVCEAIPMTWTMHKFRQEEIKTFLEREDLPAGMRESLETNDGVPIPPGIIREFAVNDDGVWIERWGASRRGWTTMFRYWHRDICIKFEARRPAGRSDNWVDYDPTNKTFANFALGPLCNVWIDDRLRRLSPDEAMLVKENITEFLTTEFRQFELVVAPYPEVVVFH